MKAIKTLQDAITYFSDATHCREYMVENRWPDGVICPRCGSKDVLFLEKYNRWHCREGHDAPQFTLKTGTVMEDSPIRLEKWLPAFWLLANCRNGISSYELHRAIGVTQKTAWFMLQRIRLAMDSQPDWKLGEDGGGPVEADETFIGPVPAKMHRDRRAKMQAKNPLRPKLAGKTVVHGLLDRELRQVRAKVIPDIRRDALQEAVLSQVAPSAKLYTDDMHAYDSLGSVYIHEVVNHSQEYVKGEVHTQGIENFWSLLKRTLRGTYVAVEPFHLDRYLSEQVFRYNNRTTNDNPLNDADRFMLAVSQIVGKRLTYAELTGKVGETSEPF